MRDALARMTWSQRRALALDVERARERLVRFDPDVWFGRVLTPSEKNQVARELRRMEMDGLVCRFNPNPAKARLYKTGWLALAPIPTFDNQETPARE